MPTHFQLEARSWRVLVLGLLLLAAFAHTAHVCPTVQATGSGLDGSSNAPCLVCLVMQAIILVLGLTLVGLTLIPVRASAYVPPAPLRPAYRLSLFTRPPPTF